MVIVCSCSDNPDGTTDNSNHGEEGLQGTGVFQFSEYETLVDKPLSVYYHVPDSAEEDAPILFLFHGNGRNAFDYRNAMIEKSEQYNFIVLAPRFSSQDYPGGDAYNLGNVYTDGDNPSPNSLNPENLWTFSIIEPLFDEAKELLGSTQSTYRIFGHSAGGQFAHRFLMFKPEARVEKILVSAPGWYTTIDTDINFPYGLSNSILEDLQLNQLLEKQVILLIGDLDNDPNASGLRRNEIVDLQGTNRFDRTLNFYNRAQQRAMEISTLLNWTLEINQGVGHDFTLAISKGADLLFEN